ncbi:MAG: hypothetical protein HC915_01705 [Anaerolineae bacterium]|nr:hypothetical protein [Anaerolineae bacterium]
MSKIERCWTGERWFWRARTGTPGLLGAVAGQLSEVYQRPVVLLVTDESGIARGAARSRGGDDLLQAFAQLQGLLVSFGGHPQGVAWRWTRPTCSC